MNKLLLKISDFVFNVIIPNMIFIQLITDYHMTLIYKVFPPISMLKFTLYSPSQFLWFTVPWFYFICMSLYFNTFGVIQCQDVARMWLFFQFIYDGYLWLKVFTDDALASGFSFNKTDSLVHQKNISAYKWNNFFWHESLIINRIAYSAAKCIGKPGCKKLITYFQTDLFIFAQLICDDLWNYAQMNCELYS